MFNLRKTVRFKNFSDIVDQRFVVSGDGQDELMGLGIFGHQQLQRREHDEWSE